MGGLAHPGIGIRQGGPLEERPGPAVANAGKGRRGRLADPRFAVAEQAHHLDDGVAGSQPVEAVRGEDPDHPIAICGRAAAGRHRRRLAELGQGEERPLADLARLVRGEHQDSDRLLADRAEAIGAVGEGLRGVRALVHLVGAIGEDRDDRAQVAGTLESLDL